jgi:hypothetical protein
MKLGHLAMLLSLVACGDSTKAPAATPSPSASPSPAPPAPPAAAASSSAEPKASDVRADGNWTIIDPNDVREGEGFGNVGLTRDGGAVGLGRGRPVESGGGDKPTLREGVMAANGKLAPEVIKRVVRKNFPRLVFCYEEGLKREKTTAGRVNVKFVITQNGDVSQASDGGSDLPDGKVVACVVKVFGAMSFPKPESGVVTVVYPIAFLPPEK